MSWPASAYSAIQTLLSSPLTRNGYALIASFAITSALGVVFWIVAARLYPQDQVGLAGVIVTTMMALSNASQLGFGNWLNRELPTAKGSSTQLILTAYTASAFASVLLAFSFLQLAPSIAPDIAIALTDARIGLWFILAAAVWTLFALQDSVLAGLRLSIWVPVENAAYAVSKLILLPIVGIAGLSAYSIFAAWTIPLLFLLVAVNLLVFERINTEKSPQPTPALDAGRMVKLIGWDYAAGLALTAALGIAPILVLNASGPADSAGYSLSWTITYALYLLGRSMGISLLAEAALSPTKLRALVAETLVYTMIPLIGASLAILILAPWIMRLFGEAYAADASDVLRLLALASIPWGAVTIRLAAARVLRQMRLIFVVQVTTLILVVSLGLALVPAYGPQGMAVTWLLAHSIVLAALMLQYFHTKGWDGALALALSVVAAAASLVRKALLLRSPSGTHHQAAEALHSIVASTDRPEVRSWKPIETINSFSDSAIMLVGKSNTVPPRVEAVLKHASSAEGMAALRRCLNGIASLNGEVDRSALAFELPSIIGSIDEPGRVATLEALIPGQDGRRILAADNHTILLAQSVNAIRLIHASIGRTRKLDEAWALEWIDSPVNRLTETKGNLLNGERRALALEHLRTSQRDFWLDRWEVVGRSHGDFTPGNLMFETCNGAERLSGILDWEQTRRDGPAEMDACLLMLALRMQEHSWQMGDAVRDILAAPQVTNKELAWLASAPENTHWRDPDWIKAMSGFVWLQHVAANLNKSPHYSRSTLWLAQNVDWVLRSILPQPGH